MLQRPKKAGLRDVAREAGVSIATVSRVFNETGGVTPRKREAVLRAIARLRYTPNINARSLVTADSRTIGVIVSNLENPFFLDVYQSLQSEARRLDRDVLMANTDYMPDRFLAEVRLMLSRRVSGIAALVSESAPEAIAELEGSGIPVVYYDVGKGGRHAMNLRVDYGAGMRNVVKLLHDLGHRSFAFVGHHSALAPLSVRQRNFLASMRRYGGEVEHQIVTDADSLEGGYRAGVYILRGATRPSAIVCVNDVMAAGVLRAVREAGLDVPGDISVTGFDNVTLAQYVTPPLTTLDIPRTEIGRLAVDWLVHEGPKPGRSQEGKELLLSPTLIVRESTGPAARKSTKTRRKPRAERAQLRP